MTYEVAERFKSVQGEGVYAGTPMAFIRFVGCSVGKRICQHCDTDFERTLPWRGGGNYTPQELIDWAYPYQHICLTGGEPCDQDLQPLLETTWGDPDGTGYTAPPVTFHVETSGTKARSWSGDIPRSQMWICVSPKPGYLEEEVLAADEVKVIVPGLGSDDSLKLLNVKESYEAATTDTKAHLLRWPTLEDALRWVEEKKIVFLQPRNAKHDIDHANLMYVQDIIRDHPQLRLSVQLHKILRVQ